MSGPQDKTCTSDSFKQELSLSSRAVHADQHINNHKAVAPPLHVSTTYRYDSNPDRLEQGKNADPNAPYDSHIYSRDTAPNSTRLEAILSSYIGGPSLTYASGLAAFHALLVFLNPSRVAIGDGYHGSHGVIDLLKKFKPIERLTLSDADLSKLGPGDIIHVETPYNPTGLARNLSYYRQVADRCGAWLTCDATFAPPPLQDPFAHGVDVIMHSGTKFIGGHSDILCGILSVRTDLAAEKEWIKGLHFERQYLGSIMGSLEGWLGIRSIRTLEIRVERQTKSAQALVDWLSAEQRKPDSAVGRTLDKILHASLQPEAQDKSSWLHAQMPRGFGSVFALMMKNESLARILPSKLSLFHHATSLGGVESLIEWRAMADKSIDRRLVRVSIGVEAWEDLRADLSQAFEVLSRNSLLSADQKSDE